MTRDRFESTSPRLALACAAVVMACTTLGVLVLLPAALHADGTPPAAAVAAKRGPDKRGEARVERAAAPRAVTTIQTLEKRS